MMRVVLATANPGKAAEIAELLSDVELLPRPEHVPDVEEYETTLEGNARLKAVALVEATGEPAVADDTGLEVDSLDARPGVYAARYAGEGCSPADNIAKLLGELEAKSVTERGARFLTVALLRFPDGSELIGRGDVRGHIAESPRGQGWGYDPLFVPDDGDGRTFAEMTSDEKHALSHRGRAFRDLAAQIGAHNA